MNNSCERSDLRYAEFESLNKLYHSILDLRNSYNEELLSARIGFLIFQDIENLRDLIWKTMMSLKPKVKYKNKGRVSAKIVVAKVPHVCITCHKYIRKNDKYYRVGSRRTSFCIKCGSKKFGVLHSWNIQRY